MRKILLFGSIITILNINLLFVISVMGQNTPTFPLRFTDVPAQPLEKMDAKEEWSASHLLVKWSSTANIEAFPLKEAHFLGERSYIISISQWEKLNESQKSQIEAWAPYHEKYKVHPDLLTNPHEVSQLEVVLDKSTSYAQWTTAFQLEGLPVEKYLPGSHFIVVEN